MSFPPTNVLKSITNEATGTFENVSLSDFSFTGGVIELVDKSVNNWFDDQESQDWFSLIKNPFVAEFLGGIEICKFEFDFGATKTFNIEIPFYIIMTGFGELMTQVNVETVLRKWNGTGWDDIFSEYHEYQEFNGSLEEYEFFTAENISGSKFQLQINVQVFSDASPYLTSFYLVYPELIMYLSGETKTINIYPTQIKAINAVESTVRIKLKNEVFSLPLVDVSSANASVVRIFDGTTIKAFEKG